MTPERWQQVKSALATALEVALPARDAHLAGLKAADPALHDEVRSLLLADAAHRSVLNDSRFEQRDEGDVAAGDLWLGRRVGAYRLSARIGEGGMGAVYRARRDDGAFELEAAVKMVRSGVSREFFLQRFRNERQILARLDHPNIARLIDGGATDDGAPYLVMELVEGAPIDDFCRNSGLPLRGRLGLFRTVCAAVEYAHQSLVVHRDLKPGNILVTPAGEPKLLDFGIATIIAADGEAAAGRTVMPIMTPAYASPEQVKGEPITTASDVYSLGVILYVLLAGRPPYRVAGGAAHEVIKAVCDTDPPRPSVALRIADGGDGTTGGTGSRDQHRAARALQGDLDAIVMKALRKRPEDRYGTVEQLRADIERHLGGLPVTARRGTTGYRVRKFVRRHALAVSAGVMGFLVVAGCLAVVSVLLVRVRASVAETTAALSASQAVSDFLEQDVLAAANPELTERTEMPVREVLDGASRRVDARFAGQPLRAAAVHRALGQAWHGVGDDARARTETQAAIDVLKGQDDPAAATERMASVDALAVYALKSEDYAGAQAALDANPPPSGPPRSTAELAQRLYTRALAGDIDAHRGRFKEGMRTMQDAREDAVRALGAEHPQTLAIRDALAGSLLDAGSYPEAEREFQALIRDREHSAGKGGAATLDEREYLGELLVLQGREGEALPMLEQLYAEEVRLFGAEDARVLDTGQTLAAAYDNGGQAAKSEALYLRLIAASERRLGAESSRTLGGKRNLATFYMGVDQWARALAIEQSLLPIYERTGRGTTRFAIQVRRDIGSCLNRLGRWSEAAPVNQRAMEDARQYLANKDVMQWITRADLATSLGHLGQDARARTLYDEAIAGLVDTLGKAHAVTRRYVGERDEFLTRAKAAPDPDDELISRRNPH